jgi:S-adenosylmethionine:tRNA ribosyltransferase-isomerase
MLTVNDFDFPLPPTEQIAQHPLAKRSESRLMCYIRHQKHLKHVQFHQLLNFLSAGDLLVFNNTKVIPARLYGKKNTGGRVEILFERIGNTPREFLAQVRVSKPLKPGTIILLDANKSSENSEYAVEMLEKQHDLFLFKLSDLSEGDINNCLEVCGHIPLPPYIQRSDTLEDQTRYQTVYAKQEGAVAAPTAGLHFDQNLLNQLSEKGIQQAFLTLHVGAGTFQPVRVDSIAEHRMHAEYIEVSPALCSQIEETKKAGGRVIAVGTTVIRALESAACSGKLEAYSGDTNIFITPGYTFKVIDGLITNFHWPRSTLLMLVSALVGRETLLSLYHEAIEKGYRFFSYGDAMLIL